MNQRMLERLLDALAPALGAEAVAALSAPLAALADARFELVGGDRDGGLLHLVVSDGTHRLRFTVDELTGLAAELEAGRPLGLERLLRLHGQRGPHA